MIHAELCQTRKQLKCSKGNMKIRFPATASNYNKLITQEMIQLYKQALYG